MSNTKERSLEIANIIRSQLGAGRFEVMTGARDFLALNSGLQFGLPSRSTTGGINKVQVVLDPDDTYTMKFWKTGTARNGFKNTLISEHSDVYADALQPIFKRVTGLDTHL